MQQGGDYNYYSQHYPTTNPSDYPPGKPPNASAPPYSNYSYSAAYSSYPSNPDPPTAPSYSQPSYPTYPSYNPTPYPPEQQAAPPPPSGNYNSAPYPSFDSALSAGNYNPIPYPSYDVPSTATFDGGYYGGGAGPFGHSNSVGFYDKKPDSDNGLVYDTLGAGVYRYDGGGPEPYGARGTGGPSRSSSSSVMFDDYGRSLTFPTLSGKDSGGGSPATKIVRAVPKVETQQDVKSGVQKFRVKLLPEGAGSTMDVLCQIGLDGIRMLDPNTNRILRIYPLETVTRWEVSDPAIYMFWSKTSVDIEPRRIRLKSNSYTTSTILDTVAAATVQLKEMGGRESLARSKASDVGKPPEQTNERKGFNWINLLRPPNEEKDHWVPDEAVSKCTSCGVDFSAIMRRHHCRNCGDIFCDKCTKGRIALTADDNAQPVRVCDRCMAEVTQRLNNAKEAGSRSAAIQSHEDLAKKLQEEMDRNRKSSSGSKSSDRSGRRMREVACPTCTVHLQVQVPASGSETIECGVCQHPFLVSSH